MVCSDMVWIKATINLTVQLKERLETPLHYILEKEMKPFFNGVVEVLKCDTI